MADVRYISPTSLLSALRELQGELAVLDVREEGVYAQGHILQASSLPLSRLEFDAFRLVPRRSTRIVLSDDADGLAEKAAARLAALGYTDISVLSGGVSAWTRSGNEIFSGLNVPAKVLGIFAQRAFAIPEISPQELAALMESAAQFAVVDCRPEIEFRRGTIPTAKNLAGVELARGTGVLSPGSPVIVTCAGRTRGLVGAQMLRETGYKGDVFALREGTMGWELDGRRLAKGASREADLDRPALAGAAKAGAIRDRLLAAGGIGVLGRSTLDAWLSDERRTVYVFDVRQRVEFESGHIAGARHVPGGQLIQNIDQHAATLGARIVLIDVDGLRAAATALWLRRMGWREVAIFSIEHAGELVPGGEQVASAPLPLGLHYIDPETLLGIIDKDDVLLVDLGPSRSYRAGHIPGAWFAVRSRLARILARLPKGKKLVLTSDDGTLAAYAAGDGLPFACEIFVLRGGNASWKEAGYPLSTAGDRFADVPDDVMLKPSEIVEGRAQAMRAYLAGSDDLLEKVARDGTLQLTALPVI